MKKLKDLTPGQLLYAIYIDYNDNGNCYGCTTVTIAQRKIVNILDLKHIQFDGIKLLMERVKCKYFGEIVRFTNDELNESIISNHLTSIDFIYCFSEEVFIAQINKALRRVKGKMTTNSRFSFIDNYYNKFMPSLMKMLNSNKTTFVQISI